MEELEELRQQLLAKEEELNTLKNKNRKNKRKRRRKIISLVAKIVVPSLLITGAVVVGGNHFGFGYPFVVDNFPAYERHTITTTYDGIIEEREDYGYEKSSITPKLEVYFPYEKNDTGYNRTIRTYSLEKIDNEDLYRAIKYKDYIYFINHLNLVNEKKESISTEPIDQEGHIVANFSYLSNNYVIDIPESKTFNTNLTAIELLAILFLSFLVTSDNIINFTSKKEKIEEEFPLENEEFLIDFINELNNNIASLERGMSHVK